MPKIKLSFMQRLQAKDQGRDILFVAIDKLRTASDIQRFFSLYTRRLTKIPKRTRRQAAVNNIRFILNEYGSSDLSQRWRQALPCLVKKE